MKLYKRDCREAASRYGEMPPITIGKQNKASERGLWLLAALENGLHTNVGHFCDESTTVHYELEQTAYSSLSLSSYQSIVGI